MMIYHTASRPDLDGRRCLAATVVRIGNGARYSGGTSPMTRPNERSDEELQREDQWDFDAAEARGPASRTRAVVSVAFARADFDRVAQYAELQGKRVSEFIREAASERAAHTATPVTVNRFSKEASGLSDPLPEHLRADPV